MEWVRFGKFVDVVPDIQTFNVRDGTSSLMPDYRRYRDWLNTHVGRENMTWYQSSKRNSQGFVAYRFRFANDEDALMFKLIFNDNIHV
jgi:hypothetical protein